MGICTFKKRELLGDQLERHSQTPEMLYALDGDLAVRVAPVLYINGAVFPDLNKIRAIHVRQYRRSYF